MSEAGDQIQSAPRSTSPTRSGLILGTLILVAAVANLNLMVANVALPDIGKSFSASQTELNLIAVAYSLGLAASVLYLGALGDRYGRKLMLMLGMAISIPASLVAAFAPNFEVLFAGRLIGGIAAGMAYPTTLALIAALWSGPARTRSIASWSAFGGAISSLGPVVSGGLLELAGWWSVFAVTTPLALLALIASWRLVPAHVHETKDPVDNLGGVFSIFLIGGLVLAINFAPLPGAATATVIFAAVAIFAGVIFILRQRAARFPLYDLKIAGRRLFWVAAVGGICVFGSLMGGIFVATMYMENVLGYSALEAGLASLPAGAALVLIARHSASLVEARGSRFTLLLGYAFCLAAFLMMLLTWDASTSFWVVGVTATMLGIGVGLAGTPASRALTGSVPRIRAGMASATADLQRDLGGAIFQSILGALLTAGYATAMAAAVASSPQGAKVPAATLSELTMSFGGAQQTAQQYPQFGDAIITAAKSSFLHGDQWAFAAGCLVIIFGGALILFLFPGHDGERRLLAQYELEDSAASSA